MPLSSHSMPSHLRPWDLSIFGAHRLPFKLVEMSSFSLNSSSRYPSKNALTVFARFSRESAIESKVVTIVPYEWNNRNLRNNHKKMHSLSTKIQQCHISHTLSLYEHKIWITAWVYNHFVPTSKSTFNYRLTLSLIFPSLKTVTRNQCPRRPTNILAKIMK